MKKLYVLLPLAAGVAVFAFSFGHDLLLFIMVAILGFLYWMESRQRAGAEQEARLQQEKYKQLAENATIGICIASPSRIMSFVSNQVLAITGNLDIENRRIAFEELFPSSLKAGLREHFDRQLEEDHQESVFRIALHEEKHLEITSYILYKKQEISGLHIIVKNITERVKLEQELEMLKAAQKESSFQVQHLIDAIPMMIYVKDLEGRYIMMNKTFLHYTNRTAADMIGKTIQEAYNQDPAFTRRISEADARVIQTLAPVEMEETLHGPWGQAQVYTVKFPFFDHNGRLTGVAAISKDNSDVAGYRNLLELASDVSQKLKERLQTFQAHLSGDIRSALREILEKAGGTEDPQKDHRMEEMVRAAQKALHITGEMEELGRLEEGHFCPEYTVFPVRELVEEQVRLFSALAEGKSLAVHYMVHPSVPERVEGDAQNVIRLLRSLLGQAFRLTEKGYIQLEVQPGRQEKKNRVILEFVISCTAERGPDPAFATTVSWALAQQLAERMGGGVSLPDDNEPGYPFRLQLSFSLPEQ